MAHELAGALAAVVGEEWVEDGGEQGHPAIDGVHPGLLVSPGDAEQVAAVLRTCADRRAAVILTGGGSCLDLGNRPRSADVLLSMRRLDGILEYNPADMTASIQAGVRLADLQAELAAHGQFLPLDPPFADRTTIGGIVATAASGPRRTGYGTVRDLLIGIRMAHPDGQTTRAGGMVVKNVTGYDMGKLYTGSLGTLGAIVEANFKLLPLPSVESTVAGVFDDADGAGRALDALVDSVLTPNSVEILDRRAAAVILGEDPAGVRALLVRFGGREEAVQRQVGDTGAIFTSNRGRPQTLSPDGQQQAWTALAGLSEIPAAEARARCRATVRSSRVEAVFGHAEDLAAAADLDVAIWGRALDGIVHVSFSGEGDERLAVAIESLRAAVAELSGSLVVEACPPAVKQTVDIWGAGVDSGAVAIMRSLKDKFDPYCTLNPGRFAHGI
ncbi:MAG: FAD-binding oxidoreductase [Chloroflexota bacterium]|jgi:glycolate oxidase FAD binding subunit|nr:FAD-binding oxidoreductase [Chloroflexota bacterium]MDP6758347.1 FAD-binding oxidoreductase [Chloroflexota bacterium]